MQQIFTYETINVFLKRSTRSLSVKLKKNNYINLEFLFELESVLNWCANKVEVSVIYIENEDKIFSLGVNPKRLSALEQNQVETLQNKLRSLANAIRHLPQTTVCDLGMGASNLSLELAAACDLRVIHKEGQVDFNASKLGLMNGTISQLVNQLGINTTKNLLLSGQIVDSRKLENWGFVLSTYENKEVAKQNLLVNINKQHSVSRIQTKCNIYTLHDNQFIEGSKIDQSTSRANLCTGNWKGDDQIPAKSMAQSVKLTLVNGELEN